MTEQPYATAPGDLVVTRVSPNTTPAATAAGSGSRVGFRAVKSTAVAAVAGITTCAATSPGVTRVTGVGATVTAVTTTVCTTGSSSAGATRATATLSACSTPGSACAETGGETGVTTVTAVLVSVSARGTPGTDDHGVACARRHGDVVFVSESAATPATTVSRSSSTTHATRATTTRPGKRILG